MMMMTTSLWIPFPSSELSIFFFVCFLILYKSWANPVYHIESLSPFLSIGCCRLAMFCCCWDLLLFLDDLCCSLFLTGYCASLDISTGDGQILRCSTDMTVDGASGSSYYIYLYIEETDYRAGLWWLHGRSSSLSLSLSVGSLDYVCLW